MDHRNDAQAEPAPATGAKRFELARACRDGKNGVTWVLDEKALKHPLLKPVEDWRQQKANLDFIADPRTTKKFWEVEPDKAAIPVVYYRDSDDTTKRHPAILERPVLDPKDGNKPKGKVLLLTVRMDVMPVDDEWHDYWEQTSTFFAEFPYLLVRYLAGDTTDANFNFATGATVSVPLPRGRLNRESKVAIDGPPGTFGLSEALVTPGDKQSEIRIGPPKTNTPGNFVLAGGEEGRNHNHNLEGRVQHERTGRGEQPRQGAGGSP